MRRKLLVFYKLLAKGGNCVFCVYVGPIFSNISRIINNFQDFLMISHLFTDLSGKVDSIQKLPFMFQLVLGSTLHF